MARKATTRSTATKPRTGSPTKKPSKPSTSSGKPLIAEPKAKPLKKAATPAQIRASLGLTTEQLAAVYKVLKAAGVTPVPQQATKKTSARTTSQKKTTKQSPQPKRK